MNNKLLILLIIITLIAGIRIIMYYSIQHNNEDYVKNITAGCFDHSTHPYLRVIQDMVYEGNLYLKCPFCNHDVFPVIYGLIEKDVSKHICQKVLFGGCEIGAPLECSNCGRHYYYHVSGKLILDKEHEPMRLKQRWLIDL